MSLLTSSEREAAIHEANHVVPRLKRGGRAYKVQIFPDGSGTSSSSGPDSLADAIGAAAGGIDDGTFNSEDKHLCEEYCRKAGITVGEARRLAKEDLADPVVRKGRDAIAERLIEKKHLRQHEIEAIYRQATGQKEEDRPSNYVVCGNTGEGGDASAHHSSSSIPLPIKIGIILALIIICLMASNQSADKERENGSRESVKPKAEHQRKTLPSASRSFDHQHNKNCKAYGCDLYEGR